MVAIARRVSQSAMLWLWNWLFGKVAGRGRDFVVEVKSETFLDPSVAAIVILVGGY